MCMIPSFNVSLFTHSMDPWCEMLNKQSIVITMIESMAAHLCTLCCHINAIMNRISFYSRQPPLTICNDSQKESPLPMMWISKSQWRTTNGGIQQVMYHGELAEARFNARCPLVARLGFESEQPNWHALAKTENTHIKQHPWKEKQFMFPSMILIYFRFLAKWHNQ